MWYPASKMVSKALCILVCMSLCNSFPVVGRLAYVTKVYDRRDGMPLLRFSYKRFAVSVLVSLCSHWLCGKPSCMGSPIDMPTGQGTEISCQLPGEEHWKQISSSNQVFSLSPSQELACDFMRPRLRTTKISCALISECQKLCKKIHIYCFKLLSFVVIC